jgi:hypothetical protein
MADGIPVVGAQAPGLFSGTETYSYNILGPSSFVLSKLDVAGKAGVPLPPGQVAPFQSKYIVSLDEEFELSVVVTFDQSPLTSLLMCLGTNISIDFAFEGFGKAATETDQEVTVTSVEGQYLYTIKHTTTARKLGLTSGFYELAATATIGPVTHKCGQHILGYGYIGEIRFQVY